MPESAADAERVFRDLATQGNKVIFGTSFGFMESMLKVAKEFPDVKFEHATGFKTADNLGQYDVRTYEGAYLAGVVAGKMSKSGKLGVVGSVPIPEVIRNIDSFTLGARSVNPKATTRVVWVNKWFDPGKEADAAKVLIGQGADIITQHTDSTAPLLEVTSIGPLAVPDRLFSAIALFALANGALINLIMASRLTYGMAREGVLPEALGRVLPGRHTPWTAIAFTATLAARLKVTPGEVPLAKIYEELKKHNAIVPRKA